MISSREIWSFTPVYRSFHSYWPWSLPLSFPRSFISVFLFIRNVFFLSLLINGGSLAYQISSKKGWAFPLMNLDPHFFPVPTLSSYDPSLFFPCPSPTAKKNQLHQRGWLTQPDKDDTAHEGNLEGKPWSLTALHRELNFIKIKCIPPKERLLWDGSHYPIRIKTCA